eukprot:5537577-Amphidinium_carterae.1
MATPLFLEFFCYEARLSSHMKRSGFRTLSLDIFRAHVRFESAVTFVDLAAEDTASRVLDLLSEHEPSVVFLQPPSDTCGRARTRPLPASWQGPPPTPLRSSEFPDGLPFLQTAFQHRLDKSNACFAWWNRYSCTAGLDMFRVCSSLDGE